MKYCKHPYAAVLHTCISIGVNGVRGVPGKLLAPIEDGVLGMEPDRLRGGLKSDNGVGGADLAGEPILPRGGGESSGLLPPREGVSTPLLGCGIAEGEGAAAVGVGVPSAAASRWVPLLLVARAGDEAGGEPGGCGVGSAVPSGASSAAPPPDEGRGGLEDIRVFRARKWPCDAVAAARKTLFSLRTARQVLSTACSVLVLIV